MTHHCYAEVSFPFLLSVVSVKLHELSLFVGSSRASKRIIGGNEYDDWSVHVAGYYLPIRRRHIAL